MLYRGQVAHDRGMIAPVTPGGPIRIAFVASTLDVGGAENVLYELITRLDPARFERELLCLRSPGTVGSRLYRSGVSGRWGLQLGPVDPVVFWRLVARFRRFAPHIVFSLDHHNAILWGGLASLFAGVPHRVIASHTTGRSDGGRSFSLADRVLLSHADAVVALSQAHADYLWRVDGVARSRTVVIPNGVDIERYERVDPATVEARRAELGIDAEDPVVIMVANMRPEKAHEALLRAALPLAGRYPRLRVLLVGDGPERPALERRCEELSLQKAVSFLGERDDVPELLKLASVLVLPSRPAVETLPLVVLEAMAAGVPVVASAVGSLPELITDGDNGRLVPPADPVGLEQAICTIIDNSQETATLVARARATVRADFAVRKMTGRYESCFEQLVS